MFARSRRPAVALFALGVGLLTLQSAGVAQDKAKKENDAVKPLERQDTGSKQLHKKFLDRAKEGGVDVLFLGDSITQGWTGAGAKAWKAKFGDWKAANFGIGGDRTQHVLWRITDGKELEGIDPKVVVLMIGTNNFGANTPDEVAAGVTAIVAELRKQKPKAKVLLLGVFPRSGKGAKDLKDPMVVAKDEQNPKVKATNEKIAKLDDGKNVQYLDIGDKFLDAAGGLPKATMPDFLHLSEKGYAVWADAIAAPVEELLKK